MLLWIVGVASRTRSQIEHGMLHPMGIGGGGPDPGRGRRRRQAGEIPLGTILRSSGTRRDEEGTPTPREGSRGTGEGLLRGECESRTL